MRILVTNDDGIEAPGLRALVSRLARDHEVHVVAPDRERSGVAHAFTLHTPLRCDPAPNVFDGAPVASAHRCSGTPVDCVKLGVKVVLETTPDWVVSGVNRGANLTIDTLYSGTVAAAMEAHILGVPALAVSLAVDIRGVVEGIDEYFASAADWCARVLAGEGRSTLGPTDCCFNLNVPSVARDEIKGLRFTALGRCNYDDRYVEKRDPSGRPYYVIEGEVVVADERDWADVVAVRAGYVSLTPLTHDLTAHGVLARMRAETAVEA